MRKVTIGVLAAAMVFAACGGSSKSNSTGAGGATGTTTKSGGGSGNDSDLSKLAAQYAKAKIKITYSSTGGGDTNITIAQDGNGKSSFSSGSSTIYTDGKSSVACEGTGTAAHCTDVGALGGAAGAGVGAAFTTSFSALANIFATLGGGDKSTQTIAGRDASCVKYKASDFIGRIASIPLFKGTEKVSDYDPNDTATICIDKQTGFLLKIEGTKKGVAQDTLAATAVGEPTDSDFTPPVTPETIPSLPGGVTIPTTAGG